MKKSSKISIGLSIAPLFYLSCLAALVGCSDESGSGEVTPQDDCRTTGTCQEIPDCSGDKCNEPSCEETGTCNPPDTGTPCTNACTPGTFQCDGSALFGCEADENDCHDWKLVQDCGNAPACDESAGKCETVCEETCTPDDEKCTPDGVATCMTGEDGCPFWKTTETCGSDRHCDEVSITCVDGCEDACTENETRCADGGIQTCGQFDEDSCTDWSEPVACDTGFKCDKEGKTCVIDCPDDCTPGETRCDGEKVRTCEMKPDAKCPTWSEATDCEMGMRCIDKACAFTCGSDCDEFSIILIPDTQYYTRGASDGYGSLPYDKSTYPTEMKWIDDNRDRDKENIRFAIHLGDITDRNIKEQWETADKAHKTYLDGKVPYTVATGNHDYLYDSKTMLHGKLVNHKYQFCSRGNSKFSQYFNDSRLKGQPNAPTYFASHNSYATFKIGDIKFLVLALEFNPRKDTLCKANEIISTHPDHHVIIETHSYLDNNANDEGIVDQGGWSGKGYTGTGGIPLHVANGATGWQVYRELAARHSNVFMVVSGHVEGSNYREVKGHNGNAIHEMLVDFQDEKPCTKNCTGNTNGCEFSENGGNGWLRQLKINPKTGVVTSSTFTVLGGDAFESKTPQFYCSQYYPSNYTDSQFSPSFTYDFGKTPVYQYKEDPTGKDPDIGFTPRVINAKGDGDQLNPAVAVHRQDGHFVAVWQDDSSTADGNDSTGAPNYDIEARIFCPVGCEDLPQFTVNSQTAGTQLSPDVAMDKNGNFVVVWEDDSDGNGAFEIWMRGFKADGSMLFDYTTVNSVSSGQQRMPKIAMADDGRFVVAWHDESVSAKTPQVLVRGFNADGTQRFADFNIEGKTEGIRTDPAIAMAPDGRFVVAWTDDADGNGSTQVRAKAFKADGTQHISSFEVNKKATRDQRNPGVAMNDKGAFFVTWEDERDAAGIFRIYGRGFDASGKENYPETDFSAAGKNASSPAICMDDGNEVYVTIAWSIQDDKKNKETHCFVDESRCDDLQYIRIKNGKVNGPAYVTHQYHQHHQPAVGCLSNGKPRLLWADDTDGNGYHEIYGTGYNSK